MYACPCSLGHICSLGFLLVRWGDGKYPLKKPVHPSISRLGLVELL